MFKGLTARRLYMSFGVKGLNIKFNENSSNGSRVVPFGHTDMTKPIVVFSNLGKGPNKRHVYDLNTT
jgi:hypothetical protein